MYRVPFVAEFMFSLTNIASVTPDTRLTDQPSLPIFAKGGAGGGRGGSRSKKCRDIFADIRYITAPQYALWALVCLWHCFDV